jgi:hypothetical protein
MSEMAFARQFDCGFSFYTRWISSAIADFIFAFLSCVLVVNPLVSRCCARNIIGPK